MHLDRDRLVWIALVALVELIDQADAAPIKPNHAIRATLATLYAFSDGHRAHFDDFWKEMQEEHASQASEAISSYCRTSAMRRNLRAIIRAVGMPETAEFDIALGQAARKHRAAQSQECVPQ